MEKSKFWKTLALVLLVLNLGTLTFMWVNKPGPRDGGPKKLDKLIIKGLHLNEDQITKFKDIKKIHRGSIDSLDRIENEIRNSILKEVQAGQANDSLVNQLFMDLNAIRNQKDRITLEHFKELYNLCDDTQKGYYHETIGEIMKHLMKPPGPPRKEP